MRRPRLRILVTGSSGFIGQYVVPLLRVDNYVECLSLREVHLNKFSRINKINTVIHLAGIAHQKKYTPQDQYFKVNRDLAVSFAKEAKESGVHHFIYFSSVKVYGEESRKFYDLNSECIPNDAYGQSKKEAEDMLLELQDEGFKVAIIRPPVVYGFRVKGNIAKLCHFIQKNKFIPLGDIENKRSMVYIGNLYDMLKCIVVQKASGIFIAGDRQPHSTTDLVQAIIKSSNLNRRLFSLPQSLRQLIKQIKPAIYSRLFEDFIVDPMDSFRRLEYYPEFSLQQGIDILFNSNKDHKKI